MILGVVATLVALTAISVWIALGSAFQPRLRPGDPVAVPLALLAGSGLTAALFAALTWMRIVSFGAVGLSIAGTAVLIIRRREVLDLLRGAMEPYGTVLPGRAMYLVGLPAGVLLWLNAIAPPRDADSMRYHLAHVRQIVQDGGWMPVADYHYALPFGWTLNYLPFELLHIPQAAQVVNAFLLALMLGGIIEILLERRAGLVRVAAAVTLVAHPFVVRTFTSANADGYAVFAVFTLCALLLRADDAAPGDALAIGFVSWIGAQSRYQLVGVAIAAFAALLLVRPRTLRASIRPYLIGAIAAMVLASPFYLANLATFGDPVWPLAIRQFSASPSYTNAIGAAYTYSLSGTLSDGSLWWAPRRLFTTLELAPLPVVIVLLLLASLKSGRSYINRIVAFGFVFLALWVVAQPRLYPRFILLLLPPAALLAGLRFGVGRVTTTAIHGFFERNVIPIVLAGMMFISAGTSIDQIRYATTGNLAAYHRFTWFYPVYAWANRALPPRAKVMVIVYSGHSYYLGRQYRRADPWLSAVVDWRRVGTGAALDSVLTAGGYDYVIYDDRDWTSFVGGRTLEKAFRQAIEDGTLVPIHSFHIPLYTSRVRRRFEMATIYVLARRTPEASVILLR